jgi:hypothetical protein
MTEKELIAKYPEYLDQLRFGVLECNDGWISLLDDLFGTFKAKGIGTTEELVITGYNDEDFPIYEKKVVPYKAIVVKEKFGGLRVQSHDPLPDWAHDMIDVIEALSYKVCEFCGSTDNVKCGPRPYWLRSLCAECSKEHPINYKDYAKSIPQSVVSE